MESLLKAIEASRNAALLVGAGISAEAGIPLGYGLPMEFGEAHPHLLAQYRLTGQWETARKTNTRERQRDFVDELVTVFMRESPLQEALLSWLMNRESFRGVSSDTHAILAVTWLRRIFQHLITTNWDFLLEYQVDRLYEQAYSSDPFSPVAIALNDGIECTVHADQLFYLSHLEGDDFAWNPRWNIATNPLDLDDIPRYSRTLWKIHGSPFFLACPRCSGVNRWKIRETLHVGSRCPQHPDQLLAPEMIFWGQNIDQPYHRIWKAVRGRLGRSDLIVVCGLSGSGSDTYLRKAVESHPNAWVIGPTSGEWDTRRVRFVEASASDLAHHLRNCCLD